MDEPTTERPGEFDEDLLAYIKPELQPDERLLWASLANPRPLGSGCFVVGLLISASCMGGFFLIERYTAEKSDPKNVGLLIIGLIAAVATVTLWISNRRGPVPSRLKRYALTDRRVIIWAPRPDRSQAVVVYSFGRDQIKMLHRVEYPDGSGDVFFERFGVEGTTQGIGFEGVAEVRLVEDLVRRTLLGGDPES